MINSEHSRSNITSVEIRVSLSPLRYFNKHLCFRSWKLRQVKSVVARGHHTPSPGYDKQAQMSHQCFIVSKIK